MRVLLTSSSPSERSGLSARLSAMSGVRVAKVSTTLSEAYHEAEHNPPRVAVFSEELSHQPEFEVLLALLRALRVRVIILKGRNFGSRQIASALTSQNVTVLDINCTDTVLRGALFGAARAKPLEPKKTGRSVSDRQPAAATPNPGRIIMIGSSTGGVEALIRVLAEFNRSCPPVFLVQHTGATFSAGLARLLDQRTPVRVCEAAHGMDVTPGMAVLAPGSTQHLELRMRGSVATCRLVDGPEIGGHRPAVDALFRSGVPAASKIAAAILTGMGRDGASGLLELKRAGARTFGQDKETSLVYGMPKVAAEMNAVERQLPIDKIGSALIAASSEKSAA